MNQDDNYRDVRINYYFKGPVVGLLLDVAIREKTAQRQSLDDVMRLLYRRYYHELKRGFTEEEFWQAVTEVAGTPLSEIRRLVDTTEEPDYDRLLAPAGLCVDKANWMIRCVENPDASQLAFQKSMGL